MVPLFYLLLLAADPSLSSPFRGWGPGEDYGNAGFKPPKENPNSDYGYDYFDTTGDQFNYSSIIMLHQESEIIRNAKYAPSMPIIPISALRHHSDHSRHMSKGGKGSDNSMRVNGKKRREKSKLLGKSTNSVVVPVVKRKKIKTVRGKETEKPQNLPAKPTRNHRKDGRKRKTGRKAKTTGSLNAGDLWSLNRNAGSFQELRDTWKQNLEDRSQGRNHARSQERSQRRGKGSSKGNIQRRSHRRSRQRKDGGNIR